MLRDLTEHIAEIAAAHLLRRGAHGTINSLPKHWDFAISCMVAGRCIWSSLSSFTLSGKPVKKCSPFHSEHRTYCLSAKTPQPMSQLAPLPDLHSLESGANACYLPPTTDVRYQHLQHFDVVWSSRRLADPALHTLQSDWSGQGP